MRPTGEVKRRIDPLWIIFPSLGLVIVLALVFLIFVRPELRFPRSLYRWHPALVRTKGDLTPFVSDLPLGRFAGCESRHPLKPRPSGEIRITNLWALSEFLSQPDEKAFALAYYKPHPGSVHSFAYAALFDPDEPGVPEMEKSCSSSPGILGGDTTSVRWDKSLIEIEALEGWNCGFYRVDTSIKMEPTMLGVAAAALTESIASYVTLAGVLSNLYLEIATPFPLDELETSGIDVLEQEPFKTLLEAHERTGLAVCAALDRNGEYTGEPMEGVQSWKPEAPRGQEAPAGEAEQSGSPTGKDLEWLPCPLGQKPLAEKCTGSPSKMDWKTAKKSCPSGYRLPTREELMVLLGPCDEQDGEVSCSNCLAADVCSSVYPELTGWHWSSTKVDGKHALAADFFYGTFEARPRSASHDVVCVR